MNNEIIYFYAPLCPKCVRVNQWLKKLKETNPNLRIIKYNIIRNGEKTKQFNIKTIPTVIINEEKLTGWIDKENFDKAIKKIK